MHGQDDCIVVFALQFCSQVSNSHVQRSFGRGICREAVFHFTEVTLGARVAGHEDNGADGDLGLKQPVGRDDGTNGVCVQVEGEFVKGTAPLISIVCVSAAVHSKMHAFSHNQEGPARGRRTARWLAARVSAALGDGLHGRCTDIWVSKDASVQHHIVDFEVGDHG